MSLLMIRKAFFPVISVILSLHFIILVHGQGLGPSANPTPLSPGSTPTPMVPNTSTPPPPANCGCPLELISSQFLQIPPLQ
ncbi:hypothetical protein ACET3Z_013483 [Daucus carota]